MGVISSIRVSRVEVVRPQRDSATRLEDTACVRALDGRGPALYRLSTGGLDAAMMRPQIPSATGLRLLVLVHGAFADTARTFGPLWFPPHLMRPLFDTFAGEVYAFEHPTLCATVLQNVLALAQMLPAGARVTFGAHGRGGVVAEAMVRLIAEAEQTGQLSTSLPGEPATLLELARLLNAKQLNIDRVVAVGSPLRGMIYAEHRLDIHLSLVDWALKKAKVAAINGFHEFQREVAVRNANPSHLLGLADLLPASAGIALLRQPPAKPSGTLRIIAGDALDRDAATLWLRSGVRHDLVIPTSAMFGGVLREQPITFRAVSSPKLAHYSYFADPDASAAFVEALTLDDPLGFEPVGPQSWNGVDDSGYR